MLDGDRRDKSAGTLAHWTKAGGCSDPLCKKCGNEVGEQTDHLDPYVLALLPPTRSAIDVGLDFAFLAQGVAARSIAQ